MILTVDGLDARIWGQREESGKPEEEDGEIDEEVDDDDEEDDDDDDHADSDDQEEPEDSDDDDEDASESDGDSDSNEVEDTAPPSPPYISHAEEQRFLNSADRLLSWTLAGADAESYGLSAELCTVLLSS